MSTRKRSFGIADRRDNDLALACLSTRARPHVDVTHPDFGASGSPADDTKAFIRASEAAHQEGMDFIFVPAGNYHCPGLTNDALKGVKLVGPNVTYTSDTNVTHYDSYGGTAPSVVVDEVAVEKTVWEVKDEAGNTIAACRVVASVLEDGEQVAQIKFYVMNDTPGTLTEALVIPAATEEPETPT